MRIITVVRYLSLALFGLLLYSCTSWNTTLGRRTKHLYHNQEVAVAPQRKIQEPWWQEKQVFEVQAGMDTVLYTTAGASLSYYGESLFNGKNVIAEGWIRFEVQEAYTPGDMILYNAPTISNGRLLESGGEINIRAFKGNEELFLIPFGPGLDVHLPTTVKENMELFYASRDRRQNLNWVKDTLLTPTNFNLPADTLAEDPEENISGSQVFLDSANGDWSEIFWSTSNEAESYLFNTKKLGWINCDRFYNDSTEKTDLVVHLDTPLPEGYTTQAYLVFEDINSVMPVYSYDDLIFTANNIPIGSKVKLVVLGEMDKLFYLQIQELEITKSQVVGSSLSPCNIEALKERLAKL